MSTLTEALEGLSTGWERDAKEYMHQASVIAGSLPCDTTPEKTGSAYSAGTYRTCAHDLRLLLRDNTRSESPRMSRLTDLLVDLAGGGCSSGFVRETLRNEGFPAEIWRKIFVVTDNDAWDREMINDPERGALDILLTPEIHESERHP